MMAGVLHAYIHFTFFPFLSPKQNLHSSWVGGSRFHVETMRDQTYGPWWSWAIFLCGYIIPFEVKFASWPPGPPFSLSTTFTGNELRLTSGIGSFLDERREPCLLLGLDGTIPKNCFSISGMEDIIRGLRPWIHVNNAWSLAVAMMTECGPKCLFWIAKNCGL